MVDQIRTLSALLIVTVLMVGALPASSALPTPGFFGSEAKEVTGRYFPEATQTNDYVGYFEAMDILRHMESESDGWVTVKVAGESYGLNNLQTQSRDVLEVPIVEVTNPDSHVAYEDKIQILFMLSIHGNEKGGREGGLRAIEDFAYDMGMAQWTNQNGAGNGTYRDYLDYMTLLFLFPNPDGWAHDEPQYLTGTAEVEPGVPPEADLNCANGVVFYCRTNGNNVDLNREVPTMGWYRERYTALSEPEAIGFANFLIDNYQNLAGATDIHGMLNAEHFVLTMMPAAGMTPHEMTQSTRLAEMLKERLNNDPTFDTWTSAMGTAAAAGDAAMEASGGEARTVTCGNPVGWATCTGDRSPTRAAGSEDVNEWGTVWDSIGYTDSGFNGDFFAQNNGLNVPGFDIELAYNHITFDSQYEAGMYFNELHIQSVRQIVAVFMDALITDLQVAVETHGTETAVLANPVVVTNTDDEIGLSGWASENPFDDAFDYANNDFFAAPQDYFRDMKPYLKDGDVPAVFDEINRVDLKPKTLAKYTNLIIPGSAYATIQDDADAVEQIRLWVENGGNLVLTDSALQYLEASGLATEGSVEQQLLYAGYTNFFDRGHELVADVRGFARQTFEPVPLGFSVESNSAPNWIVKRSAIDSLDAIGRTNAQDNINFGQFDVGAGKVRFLGSLLPDPSEEFYHPYGLESYATTYSGNQLLRNMLGWEQVFTAPPALLTDKGIVYQPPVPALAGESGPNGMSETQGTPGAGMLALLAVAFLAVALRRRQ